MNKIKFIASVFLILASFSLTSCDVEPIDGALDPNDFDNPTNGPAVFKADFSGSTWTATEVQAVVSTNFITIGATRADGSTFAILVNASVPGTYPANANIVAYTPATSEFGYWSIDPENDTADTGSVIITRIDTVNNTVSGTFSYRGFWSDLTSTAIIPVDFTNGVFTNIPYIPNTATGDTFYAKVNGTEFVETLLTGAEVDSGGGNVWLNVDAVDAGLNNVTVAFKKSLGPGTYAITGSTTDNVSAFYSTADDTNYDATTGSITIISQTATRVKGTFNFVGVNGTTTKTVSEGAFDVGY